ncbi:MAG: 4'-phosphopantetheinyl transferase superfamily protein [Xenococcaceae cyanobacterium MO_167.B52]|nr:4'-phosphopantetheinyl transferase superfamily protein [Xenococcaceae cyanobacterium MO_167.B52]
MRSLVWQNPSLNLVLPYDEIHVWRASLDLAPQSLEELETVLSEDEKLRANRFRFAKHRRRFIAARGILRQLLARYLQISPEEINFTYNPQGKPQLASSFKNIDLQFNISHSEDLALYSFNYGQQIGIDLEYLRENVDYENIAKRFFCDSELELITNCIPEQRQQRFYQLWTAKEAYLKAIGKGLGGGLQTSEIKLNQEDNIYLHSIENKQETAKDWSLYNFIPQTNFVATIALSAKKKKLTPINYISQHKFFLI